MFLCVIAVPGHQGVQKDPADGRGAAALPVRGAGREEEDPRGGAEGAVKVSVGSCRDSASVPITGTLPQSVIMSKHGGLC